MLNPFKYLVTAQPPFPVGAGLLTGSACAIAFRAIVLHGGPSLINLFTTLLGVGLTVLGVRNTRRNGPTE